MAFQSTSERYRYIYGNTAAKPGDSDYEGELQIPDMAASPAREAEPARQPERKRVPDPAREAAVRRNIARHLEFDWKYTVIAVIAVLVCVVFALGYVGGTVRLNAMSSEISELKSRKESLLSKQTALQTEIDKEINLDEIRVFAEEELNMVYPNSEHVIYYNSGGSDYFRQYESFGTSE